MPPPAPLEAVLVFGVGMGKDPQQRPQGPESPGLKALIMGAAGDLTCYGDPHTLLSPPTFWFMPDPALRPEL